jgi:XRE family transcriptional regulator, fatty acid utilization regulator
MTEGEKLGRRVRNRRTKLGMTQQVLCNAVGITLAALRAIEQGRSEPKTPTLRGIVLHLGVSADFLLFGTTRAMAA